MKYCLCKALTREHDVPPEFDVRFGSGSDRHRFLAEWQCLAIPR